MRSPRGRCASDASVGHDAVGTDLLRLDPLGHHVLEVAALALQLGELPLQLVGRTVVAHVDVGDREVPEHRDRHQDRHHGKSTATTPIETTMVDITVTSPNTTADDWPPGGVPRSLEPIVEVGALVLLELDLGGDVEDLVHRAPDTFS